MAFAPHFNRAVLFETNEHSWHGFRRIEIPGDAPTRSRKCLSIYLYTETRPDDEIAPPHGTFYVPPPLPDSARVSTHDSSSRTSYAESPSPMWWLLAGPTSVGRTG